MYNQQQPPNGNDGVAATKSEATTAQVRGWNEISGASGTDGEVKPKGLAEQKRSASFSESWCVDIMRNADGG